MAEQITQNPPLRNLYPLQGDEKLVVAADIRAGETDHARTSTGPHHQRDNWETTKTGSAPKTQRAPRFEVTIRAAELSPAESEIRLRKAFDIVFEEVFRARSAKIRELRRTRSN